MLRIKNKLPNTYVSLNISKLYPTCNSQSSADHNDNPQSNIIIRSFHKNITTVDQCLKIILWSYIKCKENNYELVLEVPMTLEKEEKEKEKDKLNDNSRQDKAFKQKCLKFDIGLFNLTQKRYTHFIEYDCYSGHYTDINQIQNDVIKERFCSTVGVRLLRISNKYDLNIHDLDNWFISSDRVKSEDTSEYVTYFNKSDYSSRNQLISKLNI